MAAEKIILGAGCFWCVEAVFQRVKGIHSVVSGYTGGEPANPTYRQICTGTTGHAEVIEVGYDPEQVKLDDLLDLFFAAHDPTTLNRQGADVGTQYRSAIFYASEAQKEAAQAAIARATAQWPDPIVTEVSALGVFYPAETYHQDYFRQNSNAPYCRAVILPKLMRLGMSDD